MMTIGRFLICLMLATTPVAGVAQDVPQPEEPGDLGEGLGLIERGARMLLRGLMDEVEPALRDLGSAIDDLSAYHAPEVLPNGDIIIRRKVPLTPPPGEDEIDI